MTTSESPDSGYGPYLDRIHEVATAQFSVKGYRGTSMRDLADELGQHAGSLYAHIRSKEDILFEIINRLLKIHERDMHRIVGSDLGPVEKLRALIHCHVNLIVTNQEAATVYFHEWRQLGSARRDIVIEKRDEFEQSVKAVIADCVADGTFAPLDIPMATKAILGMLNWMYQWYQPKGRLSSAEVSDRFADYIIDGFRKR